MKNKSLYIVLDNEVFLNEIPEELLTFISKRNKYIGEFEKKLHFLYKDNKQYILLSVKPSVKHSYTIEPIPMNNDAFKKLIDKKIIENTRYQISSEKSPLDIGDDICQKITNLFGHKQSSKVTLALYKEIILPKYNMEIQDVENNQDLEM